MRWTGKNAKRRQAALLLLAALAMPISGCLAVAAGAAGGAAVGYAYYMGEVFDNLPAGFPQTLAATQAALREMNMPVMKEEQRPGGVVFESRTVDGDAIRVSVTALNGPAAGSPPSTQVGIRVGYFGDGKFCEQLFARISAHLVPAPSDRLVPQAQPTLGPIQPVAASTGAAQSPPPPLAPEPVPIK